METIAQLDEDFARVEVVRAAEGETVVEQHAAVSNIHGLQIDGKALTEVFAERQIKGGVRLEMVSRICRGWIAVREA